MNILTSEKNHIRKPKNMNSIQKKIIKIASNLADEMIKSFEMTEEEWKKYSEAHPNAKRENHTIVQKKSENGNGNKEVEMTYEQKGRHELAMKGDREDRETIAQLSSTHPFTLDILSRDEKNSYLRAMVGGNRSASPKTLERLSGDSDSRVRMLVGANPTSTFEIQKKLSEDRDEGVRAGVAANRKIHEKIAEKLSEDKSVDVRRRLAENTSAPKEILKKLSRDHDYVVRSCVAENDSVDVDVLKELCRDKIPEVRMRVAYNSKSTNEILEILRNDKDFEVSEAADDALRERAKK